MKPNPDGTDQVTCLPEQRKQWVGHLPCCPRFPKILSWYESQLRSMVRMPGQWCRASPAAKLRTVPRKEPGEVSLLTEQAGNGTCTGATVSGYADSCLMLTISTLAPTDPQGNRRCRQVTTSVGFSKGPTPAAVSTDLLRMAT